MSPSQANLLLSLGRGGNASPPEGRPGSWFMSQGQTKNFPEHEGAAKRATEPLPSFDYFC